jgi:predicted HAD superfamily Cof-like phosphohydrolase
MENITALNDVAKFHKTFGHPVVDIPSIPNDERCNLRIELLKEEIAEFEKAIEDKNLIEIADALCDIQYVLAGAILEFGLGEKFNQLFKEVQRSNMSKACNSLTEAEETVRYYKNEGVDSFFLKKEDKYLVFRKKDNKVLKSIFYSPANLEEIL